MCPLLENAFNSILRKSVFHMIAKGRDTYYINGSQWWRGDVVYT